MQNNLIDVKISQVSAEKMSIFSDRLHIRDYRNLAHLWHEHFNSWSQIELTIHQNVKESAFSAKPVKKFVMTKRFSL
jgi:hypothetical protein